MNKGQSIKTRTKQIMTQVKPREQIDKVDHFGNTTKQIKIQDKFMKMQIRPQDIDDHVKNHNYNADHKKHTKWDK
jgi:hypothetical protein